LARKANRERVKAIRAEARRLANMEVAELRAGAATVCQARKDAAAAKAEAGIARALGRLSVEERDQAAARLDVRKPKKLTRSQAARRVAELRAESDDEVRGNIPRELVPVFDKHRHLFRDSPRRSRTEHFLEWAEESPGEVQRVIDADIEAQVAELVREEEGLRRMVRTRDYRRPAVTYAVPFPDESPAPRAGAAGRAPLPKTPARRARGRRPLAEAEAEAEAAVPF
jgi:hypothetical protein